MTAGRSIRFAIAGVGNCASALLQGIAQARLPDGLRGVTWPVLGGYTVADLEPVAAFDIDVRKVGKPLAEACFAPPNCARVFCREVPWSFRVAMAPVLDGMPTHFHGLPEAARFVPSDLPPCDVAAALRASGAEVLVCFLPVGAQRAVEYFAEACLSAQVALVNAMPVFIASEPRWAARFEAAGVPVIGDDIKSQVGATVLHRALAKLLDLRGAELQRSYQLNTGGNTDFLNMTAPGRLESKRVSKTAGASPARITAERRTPLSAPGRVHRLAGRQEDRLHSTWAAWHMPPGRPSSAARRARLAQQRRAGLTRCGRRARQRPGLREFLVRVGVARCHLQQLSDVIMSPRRLERV